MQRLAFLLLLGVEFKNDCSRQGLVSDTNFDCSCRHGISRTDFNLLSDPELSFLEIISKMPSNPGNTFMNKGKERDLVPSICCFHETGSNH